jgi:hypothetical protein
MKTLFKSKQPSNKTSLEEIGFGGKFRILYVPVSVDRGEKIKFEYLPQVLSESGEWLAISRISFNQHGLFPEDRDKGLVRGEDDDNLHYSEKEALRVIRDFVKHHSLLIFKDLEELNVVRAKEMSASEALDLYAQESEGSPTEYNTVEVTLRVYSKNPKEQFDKEIEIHRFHFTGANENPDDKHHITYRGPSADEIKKEIYSEKVKKFIKAVMTSGAGSELNGVYVNGSSDNVVEIRASIFFEVTEKTFNYTYSIDKFFKMYNSLDLKTEDSE